MANNQNNAQDSYYNNDSYYSTESYNGSSDNEEKNSNGLWWKILLLILLIIIIILLLLKFCGSGSGKSADEKYAELTERACKAAQTYISNNPTIIGTAEPGKSVVIRFQTLADANLIETQIENPSYDGNLYKKGTVDRYYSLSNSIRVMVTADGSYYCELVDNAKDVTPPELRLNGDERITLAVGTDFEDPGYSATDDFDGDITDKVVRSGNVDNSKAGEYKLTYTVQDSAGNTTTKTRVIVYEEFANIDVTLGTPLDGVTPMIKLKGANPYCMVKGTQYVEPGAMATDNVDGNITDRIAVTNKVTGNLMGAFRIVYTVEDSSGNKAIAYRAVVVTTSCPDQNNEGEKTINNAPVITLVGKNSVTINKGTEYIDLGATAYDKEDGDLTSKITIDDTQVNVNSAGIYKVIYRVTDSGGKTATKTRTVTVKDNVSGNPSVRFTENKSNITVIVGEGSDSLITPPKAVNENGISVAVTKRIEDYTTKEPLSAVDWNSIGKYRVIYTAIHGNGVLKQTKTITVTVIEGEVTIGGKNPIEMPVRNENCDINEADLIKGGVTFTTIGTSTPIVTVSDNENKACTVGTYKVKVTARVGEGETAVKTITVNVVDNGTPEPVIIEPGKVVVTYNSANTADPYNNSGKWAGGAVTGIVVKFKATPATGKEISYFEYSKSCDSVDGELSRQSMTTGELRWIEEGKQEVCIRAVTTDNIRGPWSNPVKLYLDKTGPKVEFTHTWKDGVHDWHNSNSLTLTYKATDTGSGLDHFEYTYDDVKAKKASDITTYDEANGTLTVKENTEASRGQLYVYVRAVDKAGNKGEWTLKPAYANMDTVKPNAPEITKITGNNTASVSMALSASDALSIRPSGIGKFVYTLNDGNELSTNAKGNSNGCGVDPNSNKDPNTYTEIEYLCVRNSNYNGTIKLPANTTTSNVDYKVKVWSVDRAGNRSEGYANGEATVTPSNNPATGVELSYNDNKVTNGGVCIPSSVEVLPQKTYQMKAVPIPANADDKDVTWSSSDTSVATVDSNGKITAKAEGEATITAKIGEVSATCTLKVSKQVITCAPGEYLPKSKDKCEKCLVGSECSGGSYPISDATDQGIKMCPAGTYADKEGMVSCTPCPAGTTSPAGSKSASDCKASNEPTPAPSPSTSYKCYQCGGSQGVRYYWASQSPDTSNCGVATVVLDPATGSQVAANSNNCNGTSTSKMREYCENKNMKYLTCPSGQEVDKKDSYGCVTCKNASTGYRCYACGGSQGVNYYWTDKAPSTNCAIATSVQDPSTGNSVGANAGNCNGSSTSKSRQYCESRGMYYLTCPSGRTQTGTEGHGCVTCKLNSTPKCPQRQYYTGVSCQNCPANMYCPGDDKSYACPAHSQARGSAGQKIDCLCDDGYKMVAGKCEPNGAANLICAAGQFKSDGRCVSCPSGYTSNKGATSISYCYISVAAGHAVVRAGGGQVSCGAGTYKGAHTVYYNQTSSCNKCPAGTYSSSGASVCPSCRKGTYSTGGAASCTSCPSGYTTSGTGATSSSQCVRATVPNCKDACVQSFSGAKYDGTYDPKTNTCLCWG